MKKEKNLFTEVQHAKKMKIEGYKYVVQLLVPRFNEGITNCEIDPIYLKTSKELSDKMNTEYKNARIKWNYNIDAFIKLYDKKEVVTY